MCLFFNNEANENLLFERTYFLMTVIFKMYCFSAMYVHASLLNNQLQNGKNQLSSLLRRQSEVQHTCIKEVSVPTHLNSYSLLNTKTYS